MHTDTHKQTGLSLLEVLVAVAMAGVLIAGLSGVIGNALNAESYTRSKNDTLQQANFAMQQMVTAVSKTRRLMIPLADNSTTTGWNESERNVLAVTLDPTLDRNKDGWADGNNDKDFLDVNNNGSRDVGEPELIDEDLDKDMTNDKLAGIIDIDDNGNGVIDDAGNDDDDEDGKTEDDPINGLDDDGDGSIDEDTDVNMNNDGEPGVFGLDDDFDGLIDEDKKDDDDEDGLISEDWLDPMVFYLNNGSLMMRMPDINPIDGTQFTAYPIADNVSQLLVKRILGGNGSTVLVEINLTLSPPNAEPVSLTTRVAVGSGL